TRIVQRFLYPPLQLCQVRLLRIRHADRMYAEGVDTPREGLSQIAHGIEIEGGDGRNDDTVHATGRCPFDHRLAIGLKLRSIQMAVRIDQHGSPLNRYVCGPLKPE